MNDKAIPFVLLFVVLVAFGLLIPWLGFYWDDWPVIYMTKTQGIGGFWNFYQYDRPFSAWTYIVFSPILGTRPLDWQIFTLLLRWLTALFLWASLRLIWPNKRQQVFWIALLFAVCPIFTQQPVAVAYSQHWICYLLYFCSVYFMLKAQGDKQNFFLFTTLSIFLSLVQMFTMEYFLGLELLRPLILWLYYREREPESSARLILKRVIASGWIYIVLLILYILWRLFFLHLASVDPNRPEILQALLKAPIQALIDLGQKIVQDFTYLITSWLTAVKPEEIDLHHPFSLAALAIAILAAAFLAAIASRYQPVQENGNQDTWHMRAMFLGILAFLLGTLPVWAIDRQISVGPLGSRFSLAALFGVSILIVAFLEWLSNRSTAKLTVICILVGIAIHANLYTAKAYQESWEKQRTFYWELFWRAPYIQPGTAFISDGEIFQFVGLYSTSMGISSLYPPVQQPQEMPYWFFSYWERLYRFPDELMSGTVLEGGIRNYSFRGNSKDALLLDFAPEYNRCLHFVSLRDNDDKSLPGSLQRLLSISKLEQIQRQAPNDWKPPKSIFGSEPEHGWCYYFEKAELASQYGDLSEVIHLMDEAKKQGLAPSDMKEYLPLLDAYLQTNDIASALALSIQIKHLSDKVDDRVCNAWMNKSGANSSSEFTSALKTIRERFSCFD
ncbi:MAG TPA: hypothetical protein VK206_28310 [Anaerolineales bacterium]|nr:hypothetical protein [Anaerolineales bacterium]